MKTEHLKARSVSLPKGVPVRQFETLKEVLDHVKNDEAKIVDFLNKYGRQKDCFPEALDLMSEVLDAKTDAKVEIVPAQKDATGKVTREAVTISGFGFPMKTKTEKKDGKDVTVAAESNAEHINRWANAQPDKAAAWNKLQTAVIDAHGDFVMDLNQAVRAGGKPKKLPAYLVEAATNIINGGAKAIERWTTNLTKGYHSDGYGNIEPVAFAPFNVHPAKGAKPEEVEAVRQSNITNLAKALVEVESQKRAMKEQQSKKEYA